MWEWKKEPHRYADSKRGIFCFMMCLTVLWRSEYANGTIPIKAYAYGKSAKKYLKEVFTRIQQVLQTHLADGFIQDLFV